MNAIFINPDYPSGIGVTPVVLVLGPGSIVKVLFVDGGVWRHFWGALTLMV